MQQQQKMTKMTKLVTMKTEKMNEKRSMCKKINERMK
jgi:hypothetical protein